jgi:hypothetical protein
MANMESFLSTKINERRQKNAQIREQAAADREAKLNDAEQGVEEAALPSKAIFRTPRKSIVPHMPSASVLLRGISMRGGFEGSDANAASEEAGEDVDGEGAKEKEECVVM